MTWHMPTTVDDVLARAPRTPRPPSSAGGTFLGILVRQGLVESDDWISLQNVRELTRLHTAGDLSVGAMVTHRRLELDDTCARLWPGVSRPRSRPWPARGCATSPPWAASSPTPTTPRTRRRCWSPPAPWPRSPACAAPAHPGRGPHRRSLLHQPGGGRAHHPRRRAPPHRAGRLPQAAHPVTGGPARLLGRRRRPRRHRARGGRRRQRPPAPLRRRLRGVAARRRWTPPAPSARSTPPASTTSTTTAGPRPTAATSSASRSAAP